MDLGVQIEPQFGFSYGDVLAIAREAETSGFRALWVSDHLFLGADAVATDCLEAWTLLAALAVDTKKIRIGPMVTAQSYRNPALLAKIAAGVDQMSGGRVEFGVGAGWKEVEYKAYGYEFPDAPTRVTQLVETLVTFAIWATLIFAFDAVALGMDPFVNVGVAAFAGFMLATLTVTGRHMMFRLTAEEDEARRAEENG